MSLPLLATLACTTTTQRARARLEQGGLEYGPDTFVQRAVAGDSESVALFLQAGMDPDVTDGRGRTALISAIRYAAVDVMKILLDHGASVEVRDRGTRATPLMWAASTGLDPAVSLLLERGADPNARAMHGGTALMVSAKRGRLETTRLLLARGGQIDARDQHGKTALILSAMHGHTQIVELLLDHGADPSLHATVQGMMPGHGRHNMDGYTAFLAAVYRGKTATVQLLLARGAAVDTRDAKGNTALMLATRGDWPETVELLLAHGADTAARNEEGRTALSIAREYRLDEIEQMLTSANRANGVSGDFHEATR